MKNILKIVVKIVSMLALVGIAFVVGEYHGYALGVNNVASLVGPALYRCVGILGGKGI